MMPRHERRTFVEAVDFVSGVGFPGGRAGRQALGLTNEGPALVITPKCVFDFDSEGAIRVRVHSPGCRPIGAARRYIVDLGVLDDVPWTPDPTEDELRVLRGEVDQVGLLRPR